MIIIILYTIIQKFVRYNHKDFMIKLQELNIGEIMITDVDRDGCQVGFDKNFLRLLKNLLKFQL